MDKTVVFKIFFYFLCVSVPSLAVGGGSKQADTNFTIIVPAFSVTMKLDSSLHKTPTLAKFFVLCDWSDPQPELSYLEKQSKELYLELSGGEIVLESTEKNKLSFKAPTKNSRIQYCEFRVGVYSNDWHLVTLISSKENSKSQWIQNISTKDFKIPEKFSYALDKIEFWQFIVVTVDEITKVEVKNR